jgi:hypothetical protein
MFLRCKHITSHLDHSSCTCPVNLENRAGHISSDPRVGTEELGDGTEMQSHMLDPVVGHTFRASKNEDFHNFMRAVVV